MTDDVFDAERIFLDAVDDFTVIFHGDRVFIREREYPVGQCVVDILNLEEEELRRIDQGLQDFYHAVQSVWQEGTEESVRQAQEKLRDVWTLVSALPVYRDLDIDCSQPVRQNAPLLKKFWSRLRQISPEGRAEVDGYLRTLTGASELLRIFQKQITLMLDGYFEPLDRRNSEAYAVGMFKFYSDMVTAELMGQGAYELDHSFPLKVRFVPMISPSDGEKIILAEQARFSSLLDFLEVEFFRGLAAGNAPRRCHNCGKYFLLTAGYNTCYCNNIAPGETERTCRKVGAHRKEARDRAGRTPAQVEYDRAYNRLKQRKNRGKISLDEWNMAVAMAQELLERSGRGELTDDELKRKLAEL